MSEWKEVILKDLVISANTGLDAIKRAPIIERNTGIKCLRIQDISQKKPLSRWGNTDVTSENYQKFRLRQGEIIMARTCSTGIKLFVKNDLPAVFNNGLVRIRAKTELINPTFLNYLFDTRDFVAYIDGISGGTSVQLNMQVGDLLSYEFKLPPLSEQKIIAETLSSLDDKIDLLDRQNKTLEALAETLFKQWFIIKTDEHWADSTLEKHVLVFRGLSYKGSGLTDGEGLPMHNLNSVYEGGGYKNNGIKYYNGDYRERHLVFPGDIIVTNTEQGHEHRLIGFPAIVPKSFGEKGLFSQHIYKIVLQDDTFLTKPFIYYLLMSSAVREQIIGATNGSTVNMLAIDGLQRPTFKMPSIERVNEYSKIVEDFWKKQEVNNIQIRILTQLRDTLLPKLMSGEVRLTDIKEHAELS